MNIKNYTYAITKTKITNTIYIILVCGIIVNSKIDFKIYKNKFLEKNRE